MRSYAKRAHPLVLLILILAVVAAALPGSPASGAKSSSPARLSKAAAPASPRMKPARLALAPFAAFQAAPVSDSVSTFDTNCTTPRASWPLSTTAQASVVCAKVTGPVDASRVLRRAQLVNPAGLVVASMDVPSSNANITFTLPTDTTYEFTAFGETPLTLDNRGTWRVNLIDTSDASVRAYSTFTVHDADATKKVADLQISKVTLDSAQATAGGTIQSLIGIFNAGPDNAANVRVTDQTPSNTTFASIDTSGAPGFTCTTPAVGAAGTTTCTGAALANQASASFVITYTVSASIGSGAEIDSEASVDSDTEETYDGSNSTSAGAESTNPNPPACTISCPANVTQDSDPGQAGAIVNYTAPTTGGSCGAVATDHPSGSFFPIGTTVVTANVSGGPSCSFSVTVIDKRTVAVTLNGAASVTVECHTGFSDAGATAVDGSGNSLPVTATVTVPDPSGATDSNGDAVQVPAAGNVVNPNAPNEYTITYTASDSDGHTGKATRVVHVVDTTPPVITLSGVSGFTPQTETVTVTNDDGTTSQVTATVLVGTVECSDSLTPPTATAFDGCDNHSVPVTVSGGADTGTPGTYEIIYRASDAAGNDAEQRVRVTVVDTTGPAITLNGASPMTVECHTSYTEPGATALDACEGPVSVSISGSVNPNVVGPYTITYTASDSGGRTTTKTRTVNVVDTTPPVVTLNGAASVTVECHTSYTDAGASAIDSCDSTTPLSSTSDVNVNAPGTYHVIWSATDDTGNVGTATRTVTVVDTIPPVITLNSYAPSLWPANHKYQTFAVTNFVTGASDGCNTALGVSNVVIEKVTSDEAENGNGDGNTSDDIVIASNCKSVQLRAEREGSGNGRVYTITFKVSDGYNVTRKTAKVVVPHNPGETPVDSGVHYTVNGTCP